MKNAAIFGAGIAGLSAAHELNRLGWQVRVYEALPEAGGFFRSARRPEHQGQPSEYSWHGMGPWYHNTFDLMKQIPFDEEGSMFERALSRPIDFGMFPERGKARFFDRGLASIPAMFEMHGLDLLRWWWLMLKTWTAGRRSWEAYSGRLAANAWEKHLSPRSSRSWRACFGPWIGSDWTVVSLHTAGRFFCKQLTSKPEHHHPADGEGPAWSHGARDGWLLLRGPSSSFWFDRWVRHLQQQGVEFFWERPLHRLDWDGTSLVGAELSDGETIRADAYILATDPFTAADVVERAPGLLADPQLRQLRPLVQHGPHTQVSFRIAFAEPVQFPRERTAVVLSDSEFNLTLFGQEQAWREEVSLGQGVRSLWTGTACAARVPGRLFGKSLLDCSKQEFLAEVRAQILACASLDALIQEANQGRSLADFPILRVEVWHEWQFTEEGVRSPQPKWVNTTRTQLHQPEQRTSLANLALAGAHTRTEADVWSIEGAVESGRRAARVFQAEVPVLSQHVPLWVRWATALDDLCYALGAPHFLDMALAGALLAVVAAAWRWMG